MTAQARKLRGGEADAVGKQVTTGEGRQASEQPVSWLELFFDLVFVTAFDRLAQRLLAHPDLPTFGVFALMFTALWWAWLGNTSFAARYGNSCRTYRWGTLAQMLPLAALAISVRGDLNDVGAFFALAYAAGRAILVVMLLIDGRKDGGLSAGDRRVVLGFTLGALLWAASAWLGGAAQLLLWGLALALDVWCTLSADRRSERELPHQIHFPERVGLLFIVFLGAVVTELIRGAAEQRLLIADQLPTVLSLVSIAALWRLYFDEAHTLPALLAGLTGRAGTLLAWAYAHLPLSMALSVLSVGFGLGIAEEGKEADREERLLVGLSLAAIFGSLALMRALSLRPLEKPPGSVPVSAGLSAPVRQRRGPSSSTLARLGGAALVLALIWVPIGTLLYQASCTAITLAVAYLSWRDPLREQLGEIEERLGAQAAGGDGDVHGVDSRSGTEDEKPKGTRPIEQPRS